MWLFFIIKFGFWFSCNCVRYLFVKTKTLLNRIMFFVILLTKLSFLYFGFIFYIFLIFNNKVVLDNDNKNIDND